MKNARRYRHDGILGSHPNEERGVHLMRGEPDWSRACEVCGSKPTVFIEKNNPSPLCGPCTFGEAETAGGNW